MVYKFIIALFIIDLLVGAIVVFRFRKWKVLLAWIGQALFSYGLLMVLWQYFKSSAADSYVVMGHQMAILMLFYLTKVFFGLFSLLVLVSEIFLPRRKMVWNTSYLLTIFCFCGVLYGVTIGRYDYKITYRNVVIDNLPKSFDGLRVVHISDLHLGSYSKDYKGIDRLVEDINSVNADLVLFSGDMVNNFASEMKPWIDKLGEIKSRYGNFAVTGNHDHGDHAHFESEKARVDNLTDFFKNMKQASFVMLNNENHPLVVGADTLYICGVMNYGNPPFSRHGNLESAIKGAENRPKILLTHNPTHWRDQVVGSDIALTLSGHTHAMQMGIDLFGFKWSPSQYIYDEYDGLYIDNKNMLNVSRGVGYLGMAGRIGLRPEIIVIDLHSSLVLKSTVGLLSTEAAHILHYFPEKLKV